MTEEQNEQASVDLYRRIGIKGKGVKEHQLLSKTVNERRQTVQDETKDRWSLGLKAD